MDNRGAIDNMLPPPLDYKMQLKNYAPHVGRKGGISMTYTEECKEHIECGIIVPKLVVER